MYIHNLIQSSLSITSNRKQVLHSIKRYCFDIFCLLQWLFDVILRFKNVFELFNKNMSECDKHFSYTLPQHFMHVGREIINDFGMSFFSHSQFFFTHEGVFVMTELIRPTEIYITFSTCSSSLCVKKMLYRFPHVSHVSFW